MKTKKLYSALLFAHCLVLVACSHTSLNKQIDMELAQENPVNSRKELYKEATTLIESSPNLSKEQREKLSAISAKLNSNSSASRTESLKLRSLLIKHLIADQYDEDKIDLIKKRLRQLEDQRLIQLFRAVEETKAILGHENLASRRKLMDSFLIENEQRD